MNLIFSVSELMYLYQDPIDFMGAQKSGAVFIWLTVEWSAFVGIIVSNALFLFLRSQIRTKVQYDRVTTD